MGKTPSLRLALLAILFAPLLALVAEAQQLSSLTEGSIYRIQNKAYPRRYLTPNSDNIATAQEEITADGTNGYLTQYWYVYRVNTAGTNPNYMLRNVGNGKFLKGAGESSNWTLTDAATSACNLYFLTVDTYNTFSTTDSNDGRNKMHAASQKLDDSRNYRVVGWSTDAEATSWTFTETTNAAATAAVARFALTEKIVEAKSYINLQVLTPTANGYLFCNDPYLGDDGDYSPKNLGYNLIDGNTATYFHSNYADDRKPLKDQWIRVTYPTGISTFTFNYTNRNTDLYTNSHIKTMVVEGSVDDVTYTPIKEYTAADNLPSNALGTYSSGTLGSADKVYKYLRFRVTSTYQNAAFYYIAELSVTRSNLSSAESEAIDDLSGAITTAEAALSNATTAAAYTEATNTLDEAIATYSSTMESVYAAQAAKDKELLKEKIDQLNNEYVGNNGFLESVSGSTYNWQSKYEADKSSLTELVDRMRNELSAANAAYKGTNLAAYWTHITQCEALTLEAQEVKFYNYSLPVKMSTAEATYYYSIHEKGTEDKVWQYNTSDKEGSGWTDDYCANKVKLLTISAEEKENGVEIGNPRHAFYFKRGAKIPEVYIYNAHDGYRLCATSADFEEGAGKAKFLKESTESEANSDFDNASCRSWEIIANGDYYNLRGIATDENNPSMLYAAHVASHTNNLGFSTDASADIAQFSFKINKYPNKTCPYYVLRNYINTQLKISGFVTTTNELGFPAAITLKDEQHTVTDNFNEAFHAAYFAFDLNVPSSDADIQRIYERLKKYNEALTMYVPTEATYYTFNSGLSALTAHSLAIDPTTCALSATTGMVQTVDDKTTEHTQALWLITPVAGNTVTMQNVHTGLYVQSFAGGTLSMGKNAANIVLASRDLTTGQFAFTATDASTYVLKAAEADGAVSAAEQAVSPVANAADCWTATKVIDLTTVQHPVSITSYGKAGFYSSHEVTLPAGVQAWYMEDGSTKVDDDRVTRITMTKVTPEDNGTTILPKETAVLLVTPTAPDETTTYNLTYNNTNAKAAITDNQLSGVAYSQPVAGGERTTCYKFGVVDGLAALYPMYQEYNAAGELTNPGTDEGGYIKASANKIFLKIENQRASRLEFRFTDPTTGIEQIITDANATTPADTYYDLQGRRIQGRPAGGIYIVNGVKRIIRR